SVGTAAGSGALKPLLVIGDALLDIDVDGVVERLCPDAPAPVLDEQRTASRPGGAALAAALAAADGREVTLITALGGDEAAGELMRLLTSARVDVIDVGLAGETPQKMRLRNHGRTLLRVDRGADAARVGPLTSVARAAIGWAEAILVSDYGRGLASHPGVRSRLAAPKRDAVLVWDPHPRGPDPVPGTTLATPNRAEAAAFAARGAAPGGKVPPSTPGDEHVDGLGRFLARRWLARNVCVTCSADGALLCAADRVERVAAPVVNGGDSCGAGDRFAAAAAGALADGLDMEQAVRTGVARASDFVDAGGAGAWATCMRPGRAVPRSTGSITKGAGAARKLAETVRAGGGTVVATGGCFDLLHAGHIGTLQAARALGDCLIVCLNSDRSVSRLKGAGRPVVPEHDRARVLAALACVDAVRIFEEDTPARVLDELRPDVWAKGGDYDPCELPERSLIETWRGRVVALPYLDGRSTTGLLEEVAGRGNG
ncbi:MAG TPA: PfkB family carbohydrate kinase, partial [Solirubrobacteraceae bacterium]|nr:PfkB family carbohydrate kinase [Solirubrobacteraceae bacterium]